MVGYGVTVPRGSLPVFSCDTPEQAEALITLACPKAINGEHYAPELVVEQTLDNLYAFSTRLEELWDEHLAEEKGWPTVAEFEARCNEARGG